MLRTIPFILVFLSGCQPGQSATETSNTKGAKPMAITVTSTAFKEGQPIPEKYTGEGEDISPPLMWSGVPAGTQELALICDDPDAPRQTWVHWVLYKLPADTPGLAAEVPHDAHLKTPAGALQGINSWPKTGYGGPMLRPASRIVTSSSFTPWIRSSRPRRAGTSSSCWTPSRATSWARGNSWARTSGERHVIREGTDSQRWSAQDLVPTAHPARSFAALRMTRWLRSG